MDTVEKLEVLAGDSRYDLACACGGGKEEHRRRGGDGRWLYPVALGNGEYTVLFRTLLTNACANDCKYCPLRAERDARRCALEPGEAAETFMDYLRRGRVSGLFLTSGVAGTPDNAMDRLNAVARILRKDRGFRGYIHLKVIPGASEAAIEEAFTLAGAVSLNIEAPGRERFSRLSDRKDFRRDILGPMEFMARLREKSARFARVKCTTQFIVGASDETDSEIVRSMDDVYGRLKFRRVYFSAYQRGLGSPDIPGERPRAVTPEFQARTGSLFETPDQVFMREHRLYQADFLLRKYGFSAGDILFGPDGGLDLLRDPKQAWADAHPEFYPVNVNKAERGDLLKVPGLGPAAVSLILKLRREGPLRRPEDIGAKGVRAGKLKRYAVFE